MNVAVYYNTRTTDKYVDGNIYFTQSKDASTIYALANIPENSTVPAIIEWTGNVPARGSKMKLLQTGATVKWIADGEKVKVTIPAAVQKLNPAMPALAFSFSSK